MYDTFKKSQKHLLKRLAKIGIAPETIKRIGESGYYMLNSAYGDEPIVADSFYGTKIYSGFITLSNFLEYIKGHVPYKPRPHIHEIHNVEEAVKILSDNDWFKRGLMSFRGQNQEYFMRRRFPNPIQVLKDGTERLILPGYWRKYRGKWDERFRAPEYHSIFKSIYGDFLTYYGLPDPQWIAEYNIKKYGIHTMSDMGFFEEDFNKEYFKRFSEIKIHPNSSLPAIEQHYGIETPYLDVTFDIKIALFFATHRYIVENGEAFYAEIPKGNHKGVIYSFVFHDPVVTASNDLIKDIPCFKHISPSRPSRQMCALRHFDSYSINAAVTDIDTIFYLSEDFDTSGIATFEDLFPNAGEDPFYKALLELSAKHGGGEPFDRFAVYRGL